VNSWSAPTLAWIVAASLAGGALSVLAAAFALALRPAWVAMLVSYSVGTLLGAAFLELIPHAFERGGAREAGIAILGGILGFFLLEKLLLWRHAHGEEETAAPDHGRSGALIVIGDTVHNFVDGLLIAASFLQGTELGIVVALAIVAHEIPQEVGDFVILLHSGYGRAKAFALNLLSSAATLVGGVLGYYSLHRLERMETALMGVVAASMIYVAVADLIPGLHRRPELRATLGQVILIALGIATIAGVRIFIENWL